MSKKQAIIADNARYPHLKSELTVGINARMAPAFNIAGKVDKVLFLGKGGKRINDVEQINLHRIQAECQDILTLVMRDNNGVVL